MTGSRSTPTVAHAHAHAQAHAQAPGPAGALSLAHRAWRLLPRDARRAALLGATAALAPRPDRSPLLPPASRLVSVAGELGRASGLGEGARLMLQALDRLGIAAEAVEAGLVSPAERRELEGRPIRTSPSPGSLLVMHDNPPTLPLSLLRYGRRAVRGRRIVGYWAWELPVAPPSWRVATRFVHEIWTPSRFTRDALETLMPGRVRVVPHPLALAEPQPSPLGRADFGLPETAIVVLVSFSIASSFERKNPLAAIAAFRQAFGDRPDRLLLLKTGRPDHAPADLARLRDAASDAANIRFETRMLPTADSHALTRACDIVLSLHRSEGFGLVPAEAMLMARPVIATDWSATTEFLDASCAMPIPYRLVPATDDRGIYGGIAGAVWAEADIGAAAAALRVLADDRDRAARLGAAARAAGLRRFGAHGLETALAACLAEPSATATATAGPRG